MNYAILHKWIEERVEDLVAMGVPREEAESLMCELEHGAISAEAIARNESQFLLDFDRLGVRVMAERKRVSEQAIRKRHAKVLALRNRRLRPRLPAA